MQKIFTTIGLCMILGLPLVAEENEVVSLYCSDSQVNSSMLNDSKQIANNPLNGIVVYTPSSVKNDKKTKTLQVWVQYFETMESHERMLAKGISDLGYFKQLTEFDYKNNKNRILYQTFFRCDGTVLGSISTPYEWAYNVPGSLNEHTLKVVLDNSPKKSK